MIKKCSKILLALIFTLLIFVTTVSAKEVTLDELANEVKTHEPDATYVYVIGEYVFTSQHILTTQDIMLAARTIQTSATNQDELYDAMTIAYFRGTFDDVTDELKGFTYVGNLVGKSQPKDKYEIKYIDNTFIKETVTVSGLVDEAYDTISNVINNAEVKKFEVSKEGNTVAVTVLDTTMTSVNALKGTGIATAAENLLLEDGVESVTITIPSGANVTVTAENIMDKLGELDDLFIALAGAPEGETANAGHLDGKSVKININMAYGYTATDSTEFTVSFDKKEVTVSGLVDEAYDTISNVINNAEVKKFEVSKEGNTVAVTVLDTTMTSVNALKGTGIATAAENLLLEDGVESVTITIPSGANVTVTAENIMDKLGELDDLFIALAGAPEGETANAGHLDGKSVKININVAYGYTATDSTEFTVSFDAVVSANF